MNSQRITTVLFSSAALVLTACSGEEPSDEVAAPTYYSDVQPIIEANCVSCHQKDAIGQGEFTSYERVRAFGPAIKDAVATRRMPPWLAGQGCNDYQHDPSLSDDEIATIATWVDSGSLEGDPGAQQHAPLTDGGGLSRIDHTLEMPVEYVPTLSPDDYRCFLIPWPETEPTYVTGFGVNPGNASTVHHVIAFIANPDQVADYEALDAAEPGPGYTCYGGPGGPQDGSTGFLGGWAPGSPPADLPAGTGIRMEPGSQIVLQVHYNQVSWDGAPDRTSIDVKVDREVERDAQWAFFADPSWIFARSMPIAAGDPDATHTFSYDPTTFFGGEFQIHQVSLHMHTRGVSATLDMQRGGDAGADQCLLDIPRWDFNWQYPYRLAEPVDFHAGDQLSIECHWDNSQANQPSVGGQMQPPHDINWGEGTNDEMCLGMIYVTVNH